MLTSAAVAGGSPSIRQRVTVHLSSFGHSTGQAASTNKQQLPHTEQWVRDWGVGGGGGVWE